MRPLDVFARAATIVLALQAVTISAYFVITQPKQASQWENGATNPVTWRKGVADGIHQFDVELVRLSGGGLTLIAKNVPAVSSSFYLFLDDMPAGDDYFLVFINSTHGVRYASSPRLTILSATPSTTQTPTSTISSILTLTASGTPDPAGRFATTLPAIMKNGDVTTFGNAGHAWALGTLIAGCFFGAMWTLR